MVLFTRPMGAMSKRPIVFIVLIAGIYFGWDLLAVPTGRLVRAVRETSVRSRHWRLTVLETRQPEYSPLPAAAAAADTVGGGSVSMSSFGPMIDGCRVDQRYGYSARELVHSSIVYLTLTNPSESDANGQGVKSAGVAGVEANVAFAANGFFITTSAESASQPRDPVRFVIHRTAHEALHATEVPEKEWLVFAASNCYFGLNEPQCLPWEKGRADLPLERAATRYVDLTVTWYMMLGSVLAYVPIFVGCIMCAVLGAAGATEKSRGWFAVNFWMPGVAEVITAIGIVVENMHAPEKQSESFYWWVLGFSSLAFGYVIQFRDLSFMRFCVVHFVVTIIGINVHNYINRPTGFHFEIPFSPGITLIFWIIFCISRVVVLRRSLNQIRDDFENYKAEWKALMDDASHVQVLLQIEDVTKEFEYRSRPQQRLLLNLSASTTSTTGAGFLPQNLFWEASRPSWACKCWNAMCWNATASTRSNPPLASLDQLYLHAALLEPLFVKKVGNIALASSGLVLLHKRQVLDGYTQVNGVQEDERTYSR